MFMQVKVLHLIFAVFAWATLASIGIYDTFTVIDNRIIVPPIYDWAYVKPDSLWVLTSNGRIFYSSTGGKNWRILNSDRRFEFEKISFANESNGWAITGKGDVYKTENSGKEWERLARLPLENSSFLLYQIKFLNNSYGYVTGLWSTFYTSDGGKTWNNGTPQESIDKLDWAPSKCHFLNNRDGWLADLQGRVYQTNDGGKNWILICNFESEPVLRDIFFIDNDTGWIAGNPEGGLFYTDNGGKTWRLQLLPVRDTDLLISSIYFLDHKNGWLAGKIMAPTPIKNYSSDRAVLLKTTDGGKNWIMIKTNINEAYFDRIIFKDKMTGWITSAACIYSTDDGGATWQKILDANIY
jgi:photosystem II stability/assembly factor-like uncharacterized protein